jgi:hypothetical protein
MAYDRNFTDPSAEAGRPNATDASASKISATTWPYKRRADVAVPHNIVLRPPPETAPSDDPTLVAISDLKDVLQQIQRAARLISAPWLIEPPDSESFHFTGGIVIPAQSATVFHTVLSITVPPGRNGVIKKIANVVVGGAWSDFSGDAVWQIRRNPTSDSPAAERNYENIQASLGLIASPVQISGIRVFENDVVQWVIRNNALPVSGEEVGALFSGYFYPRTWDDQFDRADNSVSW